MGKRNLTQTPHTLVCNIIVDHSDVIESSPVGAALTTLSFSTYMRHSASMSQSTEIRATIYTHHPRLKSVQCLAIYPQYIIRYTMNRINLW